MIRNTTCYTHLDHFLLPSPQCNLKPFKEFPLWHIGLRIQCCHSYGIDHSCSLDSIPGRWTSIYCAHRWKRKKKNWIPNIIRNTFPGLWGCFKMWLEEAKSGEHQELSVEVGKSWKMSSYHHMSHFLCFLQESYMKGKWRDILMTSVAIYAYTWIYML